jgi:hypothetical protein
MPHANRRVRSLVGKGEGQSSPLPTNDAGRAVSGTGLWPSFRMEPPISAE